VLYKFTIDNDSETNTILKISNTMGKIILTPFTYTDVPMELVYRTICSSKFTNFVAR